MRQHGFDKQLLTLSASDLVAHCDEFDQKVVGLRDRHGLQFVGISIVNSELKTLAQSLGLDISDLEQHSFQLSANEIAILRQNGEVKLFNRYADLWGCNKI
jgi:hypothetical protein